MSQEAVERLLGRLITDEHFRQQAQDLLGTACRQEGYLLTPQEMRLVSELEFKSIQHFAEQINPSLCRANAKGGVKYEKA